MAKKKKKPQRSQGTSNGRNGALQTGSIVEKLQAVSSKVQAMEGEFIEPIAAPAPVPSAIDTGAQEQLETFLAEAERFTKDLKESVRKHEAARRRYEELQEGVAQEKKDLEVKTGKITEKEKKVDEMRHELVQREHDLEARELDARNGFVNQNEEALKSLREKITELEARRDELMLRNDSEHREALEKRRLELQTIDAVCEQKKQEIAREEVRLDVRSKELVVERARLDAEWAELDAARKEALAQAREEVQGDLDNFLGKIARYEKKLEKLNAALSERDQELADLEEIRALIGPVSVEEFQKELSALKQEKRDLERKLSLSDEADHAVENERLATENRALKERVRDLGSELTAARAELLTHRVSVLDKQRLENEKTALVKHKQLLTTHLNDLEKRIDALTKAKRSEYVFPQLTQMDESENFQAQFPTEELPDLETFVDDLQHRLVSAETIPLYYHIDDLRVFLGGLAMTKLHILQGISGTGKTSLVKAFAKAVGGYCTDVAVQAGWRDKFDLIGHYNTFEEKYYEEECLQALYRTQCPYYQDRINIVLLDEMNLSRPEQYFAEFLSALEKNDPKQRMIKLLNTAPQGQPPPKLLAGGRKIRVPSNLWFIGTANHDETTNEFADKTQDRAHVMELKQQEPFETRPIEKTVAYSYESLQKRFDESTRKHGAEVAEKLDLLMDPGSNLTKTLADTFGIAWGNRFKQHALKFIPVVMASGGTIDLGFDHLLAARIFRPGKVTGRYDITTDDLKKVEADLDDFWKTFNDLPEKCFELLSSDNKRKERGT